MRVVGIELRAVVAAGTAAGLRALALLGAAAVCSPWTRVSFSPNEADGGALLLFTKRCSFGSYAMEESLLMETTRVPEAPSSTVLETRTGGATGCAWLVKASLGAVFKVSHLCPTAAESPIPFTSFDPADGPRGENTPCSKFMGVLPLASSGCMGTKPTLPLLRTKTAVTGW
jgi:hypothetical protein